MFHLHFIRSRKQKVSSSFFLFPAQSKSHFCLQRSSIVIRLWIWFLIYKPNIPYISRYSLSLSFSESSITVRFFFFFFSLTLRLVAEKVSETESKLNIWTFIDFFFPISSGFSFGFSATKRKCCLRWKFNTSCLNTRLFVLKCFVADF